MSRKDKNNCGRRQHPLDECSQFASGLLLIVILLGVALNLANYVSLNIAIKKIHDSSGIPGNSRDKAEIKQKMDHIKLLVKKLRAKHNSGGASRSKRESASISHVPDRSASVSALDAIEQLLAKVWPFLKNATRRAEEMGKKLNSFNERLSKIRNDPKIVEALEAIRRDVKDTSMQQKVFLLAQSFHASPDLIEIHAPSESANEVETVNCSNNETKYYENWLLEIKGRKKSNLDLEGDCDINGGMVRMSTFGNRTAVQTCAISQTLLRWGYDVEAVTNG